LNYDDFISYGNVNFYLSVLIQKSLEEQNKQTTEQLKSLFKFAQGAAHVWDVHEIGLARQERALQEKLEQCRQTHDNQNQVYQHIVQSSM
jgi:hypothetical protein